MMRGRFILLALGLLVLAACDGGFDADVWRAEKGNYDKDSRRSAMVPELMDRRLKTGARREEILALLGPADTSRADGETYFLGRSAYGVDLETLELTFDAEGKLLKVQLQRS